MLIQREQTLIRFVLYRRETSLQPQLRRLPDGRSTRNEVRHRRVGRQVSPAASDARAALRTSAWRGRHWIAFFFFSASTWFSELRS